MITSAKRKIAYSDDDSDDGDVAFTPATAGNSSALLDRIRAVKHGKKIRCASATVIKDALCVGETYDIVDIEAVNTRHPSLES